MTHRPICTLPPSSFLFFFSLSPTLLTVSSLSSFLLLFPSLSPFSICPLPRLVSSSFSLFLKNIFFAYTIDCLVKKGLAGRKFLEREIKSDARRRRSLVNQELASNSSLGTTLYFLFFPSRLSLLRGVKVHLNNMRHFYFLFFF